MCCAFCSLSSTGKYSPKAIVNISLFSLSRDFAYNLVQSYICMLKQVYRTAQRQLGTARRNAGPSRTAPRRTCLWALAQWLPQVVGWSRIGATACGCHKDFAALAPLWMLLPRHRFGASYFNTPLLLILRFFYQASSFDLTSSRASHGDIRSNEHHCGLGGVPLTSKATAMSHIVQTRHNNLPSEFMHYEIFSTTDWSNKISASPLMYEKCRIVSITWVKALASPLSHEFIQFIVEDTGSRTRHRMIADRHENGDWVIVGWNWASRKSPLERHKLPLPLVSLTYDDPQSRPSVSAVAKMLASVTARRPYYNIMKEMCWWYAEAVFEAAHTNFGGTVKEWKWARFRYSFIVRTRMFPRETLSCDAEDFEKQIVEDMSC